MSASVNFVNIPAELKRDCRFCVWKREKGVKSSKLTKVPYDPVTRNKAASDAPSTFSDISTAMKTFAMGGFDGVGIRVGIVPKPDPETGARYGIGAIDIDHCIREDGSLNDVAASVLGIFKDAYAERSPSGEGLRAFFYITADYAYDKTLYYINNRKLGLEIYLPGFTNRFVTVTGNTYRAGVVPKDMDALTAVLDTFMKRPAQVTNSIIEPHSYLSDESVIAYASKASNGEHFRDYMEGNWRKYYDNQSDADMSFISMLCFWCGCDEEQIDRIFRSSGMMRDKWDRKQSGTTYGTITIRNAVASCQKVYLPVNEQDLASNDFDNLDAPKPADYDPAYSCVTATLEELKPHTNPRYGKDEIGMGNLFADYFKPIARFNADRGIWYVYDGKIWQQDTGALKVAELAKLLADKLFTFSLQITEEDARKRYIDRIKKLQQRKNRETMLKDAKSVYPLTMKSFDSDLFLFNCNNGTLDLRTMEFRPHTPEDYMTKMSPVNYDPEARCERWDTFMKEIFQDDDSRIRYLQKALGYALTGDTRMECLFILYGATSRNGKGTTMETFLKIMGEYGRNADPTMLATKFTNQQTGGPSEEIARLAGSRFVNISEPEKKVTLDAALTKRLTGNDTITARFLHENSFEFYPNFKIFINTNHLPSITDLTLFDSGRIKIIPFNRHFEEHEQDKGLKSFFSRPENLSGIFNWVIEGYKLFTRERLEMPQSVKDATHEYHLESDRVGRFVSECLVSEKGSELKNVEVYTRFLQWCDEQGYRGKETQVNFKKELEKHFTVSQRRSWITKGLRTTFVDDVRFAPDQELDADLIPGKT